MNYRKKGDILFLLVLSILMSVLPITALAADETLIDEATLITESMLSGLSQNDYEKFSEHFNGNMKANMSEAVFTTAQTAITEKIGGYISKEFVGREDKGQYSVMQYHAAFTFEQDVVVTTVFTEENGKLLVAGFWLDSPKLRQ
ncbi:MAG: DUF3887 domain-containing protein [Sporomusa sp.]